MGIGTRRFLRAAGALLAAGMAAGTSPGGQQGGGPEIELHSDVVLVNVVATRGKGFASGLTANDFVVTEDGHGQVALRGGWGAKG